MNRAVKEDTDDWSLQIGQFISGFANVEEAVYRALSFFGNDPLAKYAADLRDFHHRTRFLQALLRSAPWPEANELSQWLEESLPLAKLRNQLAHSPLYVNIGQSNNESVVVEQPSLYDAKKGHELSHINLSELDSKQSELTMIYFQIHGALQKIHGQCA